MSKKRLVLVLESHFRDAWERGTKSLLLNEALFKLDCCWGLLCIQKKIPKGVRMSLKNLVIQLRIGLSLHNVKTRTFFHIQWFLRGRFLGRGIAPEKGVALVCYICFVWLPNTWEMICNPGKDSDLLENLRLQSYMLVIYLSFPRSRQLTQ